MRACVCVYVYACAWACEIKNRAMVENSWHASHTYKTYMANHNSEKERAQRCMRWYLGMLLAEEAARASVVLTKNRGSAIDYHVV